MDPEASTSYKVLERMLDDESAEPTDLPLSLLKHITDGFSGEREIGRGGFAVVYRGMLRNGMVAVKKLFNAHIDEKKFLKEVGCLMNVKHINVVRFLGYCADTQGKMADFNGKQVMADVQERLLCFEYLPKGSLHDYITDSSCGLEWRKRYQIINGISKGLHYLHKEQRIVHLDLKPENILLDDNMVPKIADFGLSRCFDEKQTHAITSKLFGSMGYLAPEFSSKKVKFELDIYSLGVIIIEILTGEKGYPNVDNVLESWRCRLEKSEGDTQLAQVRVCAEIGIECTDSNPARRPVIQRIIERLDETESTDCSTETGTSSSVPQVSRGFTEAELLDVHPLELRFFFQENNQVPCPLSLTNKTDRYVGFRITSNCSGMYWHAESLCGIVKPYSTHALISIKGERQRPQPNTDKFKILMITLESEHDLKDLMSSVDCREPNLDDGLLKRVQELQGEVHEAMLTPVINPTRERMTSISMALPIKAYGRMTSLDVHPTEPWILVGHWRGCVSIWNYQTKTMLAVLELNEVHEPINCQLDSAIFIARRKWIVFGDIRGYIHVYTCPTPIVNAVKKFQATNGSTEQVSCLAVHPSSPFLLSSQGGLITLWNWDECWVRQQTFMKQSSHVRELRFNRNDANIFVTSDSHKTVQVWKIDSHEPITTLAERLSIDYAFTNSDWRNMNMNMITESPDGNIKMWDLQTKTCVHTIILHHNKHIYNSSVVACHPMFPILVASRHDTVSFWNSITCRLEKTVSCTLGEVSYFGFIGIRGLVIGCDSGIEILEIDMERLASQQ